MENYGKCLLHHCTCKVEKTVNPLECQLHWGNLLHCYRRGASAKRTQADVRKSLMSSSSQEPSAPGKPAALFSARSEEPENQHKSQKNADPSNLGGSLLESNEDRLLIQARAELVKQEHQVESLNNCIRELQQQTHA